MKHLPTLIVTLLCLASFSMSKVFAQQTSTPDHRFAIRWNTLGLLSLDAIGELEYSVSKRLGVYVGAGFDSPTFGMVAYNRSKPIDELPCKQSIWGAYAGVRISTPLGKLVGLSVKPATYFQLVNLSGPGCIPALQDPSILEYKAQIVGGLLSVAYAQTFLKRFFVEPSVGIGMSFVNPNSSTKPRFVSNGLGLPLQLNLGFRF